MSAARRSVSHLMAHNGEGRGLHPHYSSAAGADYADTTTTTITMMMVVGCFQLAYRKTLEPSAA